MAIKFEDIKSQGDLDNLIEKIKATSKQNYEEAAERTKSKIDQLEADLKAGKTAVRQSETKILKTESKLEESNVLLTKANSINDKHLLAGVLAKSNVNPKFNDIVITKGELDSTMKDGEINKAIETVAKEFPEFLLNPKTPTKDVPMDASDKKEPEFNLKQTFQ